jgi:hypothetical protein
MTTRHELSVVDFFIDRIAVASPQWENGLDVLSQRLFDFTLKDVTESDALPSDKYGIE